jgi:hypothetical protein
VTRRPHWTVLALSVLVTGVLVATPAAAVEQHHAVASANPFLAPGGLGAPHVDSRSANASVQRGPGAGPVEAALTFLGGPCPTVLATRAAVLIGYCLDAVVGTGFQYSLRVLDPVSLTVLASLPLPPTGPDGVYPYLDQRDRIVVGTGAGHVLRVASKRDSAGTWHLDVQKDWDVSQVVTGHCGAVGCDYIVSVKPDWDGRIWFSSAGGIVGALDPFRGTARAATLPSGEVVAKAMSTAPSGVAVVSDHALYLLNAGEGDRPIVRWREPYDRGSAIKAGQRSQASGTAPTFFGPDGDRYLSIVDNADSQEHVLVFRVRPGHGARLICSTPVFSPGASATDNTSIASGRSLVVSNTSGYNYFDYTPIPLPGGLTKVDVRVDESGCDVDWTAPAATTVVPKLSLSAGYIYLLDRTAVDFMPTYSLVVIDADTGAIVSRRPLGTTAFYEGLGGNGLLTPDGTFYQSTLVGILRIRPLGS